jgi:hypothetical protein
MENYLISPLDIIKNEGKIFDVRTKLNGMYDQEGLALDLIARKESIAQYQLAIDVLTVEQQREPDLLSLAGVGGSFANGKFRLGVFDATDPSRTYDRVSELIDGRSIIRFTFPSDLDVVLKISGDENILEQLARKLYRTTGVLIDFKIDLYANRKQHPPMIPIESLIRGGAVQFCEQYLK